MNNIKKVCYIPWIGTPLQNEVFHNNNIKNWEQELKKILEDNNIEISTSDVLPIKDADAIVMLDNFFYRNLKYIREMYKYRKLDKCVYIDYEPPTGHCRNHSNKGIIKLSKIFKNIITYNDDVVDNNKIIKGCIANFYTEELPYKHDFKNRKLITMVANNTTIDQIIKNMNYFNWTTYYNKKNIKPHPKEIYSKRKEAASYFMRMCPDEFDLYGLNWGSEFQYVLKGHLSQSEKCKVISKYKFIISYDSMINQNGYISEKIFDAFKAKTVPIYWGASNIEKYIPKECFIDKRKFKTYEELYDFITNMTEEEYENYIQAIEKYLQSDTYKTLFSSQASANIIKNCLFSDNISYSYKEAKKNLKYFENKSKKVVAKEKVQYYIKKVTPDANEVTIGFKFVDFLEKEKTKIFVKKNKKLYEIKKMEILEEPKIENSRTYKFDYNFTNIGKKEVIEIVIKDKNKLKSLKLEGTLNYDARQIGLITNKKKDKMIYYNYYSLHKLKKILYLITKNPIMLIQYLQKKMNAIEVKIKSKLETHKILKFLITIAYKILKLLVIMISKIPYYFWRKKMLKKEEKTYNTQIYTRTSPRVTIMIPAYNASKYLREAIDSALAQTYPNIEILVINDGSNDKGKTEKIAKSYGDKIRYYYKENGGVSSALNFGISKMTGDYFSWLSHDDKYYPQKIEKQIKYLEDNNLTDKNVILYSDYDLMDNHSRVFATSIKNHQELVDKPEYCLLRGSINGLSLLIPKEAFKECGIFDEKLKCAQDYELWERMQKKYKFVHQEEILVTTRLHEEQQGNTSKRMLTEGNEFWINLIKHVPRERKEQLEGTEYNFYSEMYDFLKTTPYELTMKYVQGEMEKIEKKHIDELKNIKVSIIIPFYNRIEMVVRAIDTALNQTHKNIEIILVDDGSTDNLEQIKTITSEHNNIIKYIRVEKNRGASHARNVGIKAATGEYIAFLDSDDCFKKEKIEKQLKETYLKGYNFSHTSYIRKDETGEHIIDTGILKGKAVPRIIGSCGIATPTVMIKRKFLEENNISYDDKLEIGEDICFYIDALSKTEILGIQEPLTIVNTSSTSAAYNSEKQLKGLKTIARYVLNDEKLEKNNYEIGLLFQEYIRVFNMSNNNIIAQDDTKYLEMQNSMSWKITKPLRTIKDAINLYKSEGIVLGTKKIIKKVLKKLKILK